MVKSADLDEAYGSSIEHKPRIPCEAPECFVGSYAPVSQPGKLGAFYNNTYLLRPDRKREIAGPVAVRCSDLSPCIKKMN